MASSPQPIDPGAILRSGMAVVPDLAEQNMRRRLLDIQQMNAQTGADQEARLLGAQKREVQRQGDFSNDFDIWARDPTFAGISQLMGRYPEYHEQIRRAWEAQDENVRTTDRQQIGEAFGALANGRPEIAARVIRARRDADMNAGEDVSDYDEMLSLIESDNPDDQRRARSMMAYQMAATLGDAQFASGLDRLLDTVKLPDWENYARSLGLTPGTDEYRDAMRDYVLRGSGPTSHGYDMERIGEQHRNRLGEIDRRETNYRDRPRNPNVLERIRQKIADGEALTPGEQRVWDQANSRGGGSGRGGGRAGSSPAPARTPSRAGAVIVNPTTGQRMRLENGRWVPIR